MLVDISTVSAGVTVLSLGYHANHLCDYPTGAVIIPRLAYRRALDLKSWLKASYKQKGRDRSAPSIPQGQRSAF
jgi:hypothetical protein